VVKSTAEEELREENEVDDRGFDEPTCRKIFNILFISIFAATLGLGIIAPLTPIYALDLGATGIWLGMIFSGFSLSRAIFMPLIGRLSDVSGRKRFITVGLLIYSVISLLYLFAADVFTLVLIRFVHGFASAMVIPIAMAYVGETTKKGHEGEAMGTFTIALFLGIGMGPFLGGILYDTFSMAMVFIVMAALSTFALFTSFKYLPDVKSSRDGKGKKAMPFREILKNDVVKGLIFFRAGNAMGRGGLMAFLPIFAASMGIGSTEVGILLSVVFLLAILQKYTGRLADRYSKFNLVLAGTTLGALGIMTIPMANSFWTLLIICFAIGLTGAMAVPAATALAVQIGTRIGMGTSMGIFNTAMSIGMIIAPITLGLVMDAFGTFYIFVAGSILNLIGALGFFVFVRKGLKNHEDFTQ
jgi:MFS family permease